jgi:hypothetical protein
LSPQEDCRGVEEESFSTRIDVHCRNQLLLQTVVEEVKRFERKIGRASLPRLSSRRILPGHLSFARDKDRLAVLAGVGGATCHGASRDAYCVRPKVIDAAWDLRSFF